MTWSVYKTDLGEKHVVPDGEEHSRTQMCWCKPAQLAGDLFVHHSADQREHTVERQ